MAERRESEGDRGRSAGKPSEIPKPGWRDILLRVKDEQKKDNLSIVAAGVAFYSLLAIFPAIAAAVSIYGLVADTVELQRHVATLGRFLPPEAFGILNRQLGDIVAGSGGALTVAAIGGIVLALWAAAKGMKALIIALNITYDEEESRGFFKLNGLALLLTLGSILFFLFSLTMIVVIPVVLEWLGLPETMRTAISLLRWPLLAVFIMLALAALYRYAPARDEPRWQWVSWGAVIATILWLVASALFSWYASNFGKYNETYGSMGAVIILLMWFFLSAYAVLIGAEFNAEMEHQTGKDTTRGKEEPMGRRNAEMADTVGRKP